MAGVVESGEDRVLLNRHFPVPVPVLSWLAGRPATRNPLLPTTYGPYGLDMPPYDSYETAHTLRHMILIDDLA